MIRLAVPNKGRLRDPALGLLRRIGLGFPTGGNDDRLVVDSHCGRCRLLSVNARDVPTYVARGAADCAITGTDLIEESGQGLPVRTRLGFGRSTLVVAVPEEGGWATLASLPRMLRVATVYPRLASAFFAAQGREIHVVSVSGAVEAAPGLGLADAIVDVTETGSTLRSNGLAPIATVLESEAGFVVRPGLPESLRSEVDELDLALRSVVRADRCRYLMANVPVSILPELPALLPGVEGPTVLRLLGRDDLVVVHAVVEASAVNGVTSVLKSRGATGILIASLERMVP